MDHIDNIRNLMNKAGLKPEMVDQVCESLSHYADTIKEQYETQYKSKLEAAKKICIDESENHKKELAKRLQIFCEAQVANIQNLVRKQVTVSESKALTKLKELKSLLEGIHVGPNSELDSQLKKMKAKLAVMEENRQKAITFANRQTTIAKNALDRAQKLEAKVTIMERKTQQRPQITESTTQPTRKIFQRQGSAKPATTRRTLVENQVRHSQPTQVAKTNGELTPADIAALME